jgi:hypothetical protein
MVSPDHMIPPIRRTVFLSYADADRAHAMALRDVLQDLHGSDVWVRDFDLSAGDAIAETVAVAISEAGWFVLLISANALNSEWVKNDANVATFRSMLDHNFRIITVRLDGTSLPKHLELALASAINFDIARFATPDDAFIEIATWIDRTEAVDLSRTVYVDRGDDADRFALLARRNKVIFILGWPGIGKTSFVQHSIKEKLRKEPRRVMLTRGHSLDLLAREIIQTCRMPQPVDGGSDDVLLETALSALANRADKFFLLLDDAETALQGANTLHDYLHTFLARFLESGINTHVILALTRNLEYPASIATSTDMLRLEGMQEPYIRDALSSGCTATLN